MPAKKEDAKKKEKAAEPKVEEKKEVKAEEKKVEAKKAETKKTKEPKEEAKETKKSSANVEKIAEMVEKMTVLELSDLVKVLEDRFGVTAAAPVAMMAGAMPAGGSAAEVEEQTEFDVILKDFGSQKIQVIKVVRALTGLGLIEAKKMVEEIPSTIKEGITKDEAEEVKKQIEEVGATIEIK